MAGSVHTVFYPNLVSLGSVHVNEGSLVWLLWNETKLKDFAQVQCVQASGIGGRVVVVCTTVTVDRACSSSSSLLYIYSQIDSCMPTKSCGRYHYRPCPKLSSAIVRMVSFSSPLDERRFARLNDFGKTSQTFDDVGVFWHSTRRRTALGIHVDPTAQVQ